jgi:hypothetical protein
MSAFLLLLPYYTNAPEKQNLFSGAKKRIKRVIERKLRISVADL